uniref:Interleukin-21 receptor-like n=1 Tax=Paramormyrops kingsleyae TaxID=1676925 RepID=A0A3B3RAJ8_9TELE
QLIHTIIFPLFLTSTGTMDEISCVNDYLFTITCTVRISKGSDHIRNISYWLEFQHYGFEMSCHFLPIICLSDCWFLFLVKPVAPCNLSVHWFPGGYNFTWQNSYEKIQPRVFLIRYLKYRLWYYRSGDSDDIELFEKLVQVEDLRLEPDTEYIAKVSSSPISNHYCGQWSDWSPAVRWRTYKRQGNGKHRRRLSTITLHECALLLVGLAACAAIAIIVPTPEPFFQSLYNKYKGDFKSWVMSQGNLGRPLNIEEPLKLDTLVVAPPIDHKESYILPPLQHTQTYTTYVNPLVNTYGIDPQDSLFSVPFLMPELSVIVGSVLKHTGPDVGDSRFGDLQCSTGYSNNYCTLTATGNELIPSKAPEEDCDGTLQFTKL